MELRRGRLFFRAKFRKKRRNLAFDSNVSPSSLIFTPVINFEKYLFGIKGGFNLLCRRNNNDSVMTLLI